MPDNPKKSQTREFLTTYFGGDSTGVRNWLVVTAILTTILITLFIGLGTTIGSPLYFGLLIGFGALTAASIISTLVSGIFSLYDDYQQYKNKPGLNKNYLFDLLGRLWAWIKSHPFATIGSVLIMSIFLYGIISLVTFGAAALATPTTLFISHTLGINLIFILSILYSAAAFITLVANDIFSRFWNADHPSQKLGSQYTTPSKKLNHSYPRQKVPSTTPLQEGLSPLISVKNNIATLQSGQMFKYNPTAKNLTEITENSNSPGSYTHKYKNGAVDKVVFKCLASNYFIIAYNQISNEYFFLNIAKSQAIDEKICQRFFQRYSGAQQNDTFNIFFFALDNAIKISDKLGIAEKNVSTFIKANADTDNIIENATFTIKSGSLKLTDDEKGSSYSLNIDEAKKPENPTNLTPQ